MSTRLLWQLSLVCVGPGRKPQRQVLTHRDSFCSINSFRSYFVDKWTDYLKKRQILEGTSDAVFPEKFGVKQRDAFYKSVSFSGWGGASGHDAPMIAYVANLNYKRITLFEVGCLMLLILQAFLCKP